MVDATEDNCWRGTLIHTSSNLVLTTELKNINMGSNNEYEQQRFLKEMSLNDAVEYLKQNPKESVKVTLSEDERNGINDFFKHYDLNKIYKKDGESEGGRW